MRVNIDVHLVVNGTRTMLSAPFEIWNKEDISQIAHEWIMRIRRETGYYGHHSIIQKVIVNGDIDVTDQVKEIDERPIPDLPFLW
jgi:hypothetical protein